MGFSLQRIALTVAVIVSLVAPSTAAAISDPEQAIGGAGSKWFSGSLIQQTGENCSVLGEPYTEVMVSGVGSYGGAPGGGAVHVNDPYWVSLLVSIPGNPCGSGSASVATDLALPAHTQYDSSRPIRCFGTQRFSDDFFEITNQTWSFLGQSGRYCPTGPSGAPIGQRYGFRPLANGQMFWIFVPVRSSATLGAPEEFNWLTQASGVYANPGRSYIWANVFPAGGGGSPFVYFAHDPAAIPFWSAATPGTENRVEFFANAYVAGEPGYLHYEIRRTDNNGLIATDADDLSYNGTVGPGMDLVQVEATGANAGPNGGYVPFAYGSLLNVPMQITWDFTYDGGASHAVRSAAFRTLAGPDDDGDGVANASDLCPATKGTLASGCLPAPPKLKGDVALNQGAKLKRRSLVRGRKVRLTCNLQSKANARMTLRRSAARRLGLKSTRVAGGRGSCNATAGGTLTLKLTRKAARKLRGAGPLPAKVITTFTRPGSPAVTVIRRVKIV